jgi:non-ribosomal peptide synthetase component E (peptide arylation enzyme)
MAEGLLTYTRLDDPEDVVIHTSGGPLAAAAEIRVVDGEGRDVAPGEVGELLTRGPYTLGATTGPRAQREGLHGGRVLP